MDSEKLLKELDRIIDIGIVNAHHDKDVLKQVREKYEKLHDDLYRCGPCMACQYASRELCDPDADYLTNAFQKWRGCIQKSNFRWRYEDETE